jgi:hypothetical protein
VDFILENGGLVDSGGELAGMDANAGRVGKNAIVRKTGRTLDAMAEVAHESGYLKSRDIQELLDGIASELRGQPVHSPANENADLMVKRQQMLDLQEALGGLGLDVGKYSNAELRDALFKAGQESWGEAGRLEQGHDAVSAMLAAKPVVVDAGILFGKHGPELRDAARGYYPDGETEKNIISGEVVKFVVKGFREMKSHSGDERVMLIVPSLHELFKNSTPLWTNKDDGTHKGVKLWHHFGVRAVIGDQDVVVRLAAREMESGELEYLHYDADVRETSLVEKAVADELSTPMQNRSSAAAAGLDPGRDRLLQWLASVKNGGGNLYQLAWQNAGTFSAATDNIMQQQSRGHLSWNAARDFTLTLTGKANFSTFLHESAHFYLEVYRDLVRQGDLPEQMQQDWEKITRYLSGYADKAIPEIRATLESLRKQKEKATEPADLRSLTAAIAAHEQALQLAEKNGGEAFMQQVALSFGDNVPDQAVRAVLVTPFHEAWARSMEGYFMEGKAPSVELMGAFSRFRVWMKSIYQTLTGLNVKLTDDVREVMDRMFAMDDEITAAREMQGAKQPLTLQAQPEELILYSRIRNARISAP